jgi:hypothetical protein
VDPPPPHAAPPGRGRALAVLWLGWGLYFLVLWPRMLFWQEGGIRSGWRGVHGDWAAHFAYASVFAYRPPSLWLAEHPLYAGRQLRYHFVADAVSGLLIRAGLDEVAAFVVPSILTTLCLVGLLYRFYATRFALSAGGALLSVSLFLGGGGLGFWWTAQAIGQAPDPWAALWFPPLQSTHQPERSLFWLNTVTGQLVPQRALLLGVTCGLAILMGIEGWYRRGFREVRPAQLVAMGLAVSSMLVIHLHSYIVLLVLVGTMALFSLSHWRRWLVCLGTATVVSLPLAFSFYAGDWGRRALSWYPGWLSRAEPSTPVVWFWLLNWGLFLPLAGLAVWRCRLQRHPLVVGALVLFVLGNLLLFQPYPQANDKLLLWSHLILAGPVAALLARWWGVQGLTGKLGAAAAALLMTASGGLDLWRVLRTDRLAEPLWSADDLGLAREFRRLSQPSDRVLAADQHNHWVSTQTGRPVLFGYRGWLATYGFRYRTREAAARMVFAGGDQAETLLRFYRIGYVVIGPDQRGLGANEDYFRQRYPAVLSSAQYRVYHTAAPPAGGYLKQ